MCRCQACGQEQHQTKTRRFRPISFVVQLLVIYIVLVAGGGTLINTKNPVAVEAGKLLQTVTLVHPAINWARHQGFDGLAGGLGVVAGGVPVHKISF